MNSEFKMYDDTYLEACAELYMSAFNSPPLNYSWITKQKAVRYINDITKMPGFIGYICVVEEKIMAFSLGTLDNYFEGSIYEIKEFAVEPNSHRLGYGSELLKFLENKLAGFDVKAISLNTSKSIPAFKFYTKNGYEEVADNVSLTKWIH